MLTGGLPALPDHADEVIAGAGGLLGAMAYTFLAGPIAEEFGWRGYVQPAGWYWRRNPTELSA